jgi:hypothetical protein
MSVLRVVRLGLVCFLMAVLSGCALFGGGKSDSKVMTSEMVADQSQHEVQLRALVDRRLTESSTSNSANNAQLLYRKPFYYREYVEYPDDIDSYLVEISKTEYKGTPYVAKVRLAKKRYVTALEKKKPKARKDSEFFYSTGMQTLSYEMRHGKWLETGSVFVAQESQARTSASAKSPAVAEMTEADSSEEESPSGLLSKLKFWR